MIASLIILNILGFLYLYVVLSKLIKKTGFYTRLEELYIHVSRLPVKIQTKGDLRRAKKYRPHLRVFRRKLLLLVLVNTMLFMLTYTGALLSTMYIVERHGVYFVKTPIAIPFFTLYDELGNAYISTYSLIIITFATISYPVTKELRFKKLP